MAAWEASQRFGDSLCAVPQPFDAEEGDVRVGFGALLVICVVVGTIGWLALGLCGLVAW